MGCHTTGRTEKRDGWLFDRLPSGFLLDLWGVLAFLLAIYSLGERLYILYWLFTIEMLPCLDLYHKGKYHRPALGLLIIKSI